MNWLRGLRHVAIFGMVLLFVLWALGVSDEPRPELSQSIWTRIDVGFGFILGWIWHGIYRFVLYAWPIEKTEQRT